MGETGRHVGENIAHVCTPCSVFIQLISKLCLIYNYHVQIVRFLCLSNHQKTTKFSFNGELFTFVKQVLPGDVTLLPSYVTLLPGDVNQNCLIWGKFGDWFGGLFMTFTNYSRHIIKGKRASLRARVGRPGTTSSYLLSSHILGWFSKSRI